MIFDEFYDADGNCLASANVRRPPKPWLIKQSGSQKGESYPKYTNQLFA
jgi:hypothetical protein